MMDAWLLFCVAVGARFLRFMSTYDTGQEQPKDQQQGQQRGRKRIINSNRRKGITAVLFINTTVGTTAVLLLLS